MEPRVAVALALVALLALALVGLGVVVVMGHVYMTSLAFGHTKNGDTRSYELKDWQMHMVKVAMVSFWVSLAFQLLSGVYWLANGGLDKALK